MPTDSPQSNTSGDRDQITTEAPSATPEDLGKRKLELECSKLELEREKIGKEIRNLNESRSWWWSSVRGVKLTEWCTAVAILGGVFAGYWTGWFNSIRERLATEENKLAVQKIHLEEEKQKLVETLASLHGN